MSPNFKHALRNYVRRGWWVWIVALLFHLPAVVPLLFGYASGPLVALILVVAWNSNLELTGWVRTLCTLPLSRAEIGCLRWWNMIGVPGLVLSALTVVSLVAVSFVEKPPTVALVAELIARTWGALGIFMLMGFFGRVLGAVGLACLVIVVMPPAFMPEAFRPLVTLMSCAGMLIAVYLYIRLESFIPLRTIERPAPVRTADEPVRNGMSGWWAVVRQQVPVVVTWTVIFAALFALNAVLLPGKPVRVAGFILPILAFSYPMFWIPAARVFRSLPMTASQLAFALMLMTMLPAIFVAVLCYAIGAIPSDMNVYSVIFLFCCAATGLPYGLRFGYRPVLDALARVPFIAAMIIAVTTTSVASPTFIAIQLGASAAILAASWHWTRHELVSGVHAYRPRAAQPSPYGLFGSQGR